MTLKLSGQQQGWDSGTQCEHEPTETHSYTSEHKASHFFAIQRFAKYKEEKSKDEKTKSHDSIVWAKNEKEWMVMIYNVTRLTGDIPTYEVKSVRES